MQFANAYPYTARWVQDFGWVEMGYDHENMSFIRVLDIGGLIWESEYSYPSMDAAMMALEQAIAEWMRENHSE